MGRLILALLLLSAVVSLSINAAPVAQAAPAEQSGENWDRKVDRAALLSQEQAIAKFQALATKYKNDPRETAILIRLIEAQEVGANMEFRIGHGENVGKATTGNPVKYLERMKKVVETCSYTIAKYPNAQEMVRVYYARGYANSELKNIPAARRDYDFLTVKYSETPWAVRANMALAEFSIGEKDYRKAISYLKRIEAKPRESAYPLALYSMAWAHFNLNDIDTAMSYIQRNVLFYRSKRERSEKKTLSITERALWEHSLRDAATFYFEGVDKIKGEYTIEEALPTFHKLEEGPYLGNMIALFAKLLRSRDRSADLEVWTELSLDAESDRPEALDVVMTNFEYLSQRRTYDKWAKALHNFSELDQKTKQLMRKYPTYPGAQTLLLQAADALQKTIAGEKNPAKAIKLGGYLIEIYSTFASIVEATDPRLLQVHYNLAETLFKVQDFDRATNEYLWVIEKWNKKAAIKLDEIRLKAIASRYQQFSKEGKLPQALKPSEVKGEIKAELDDLDKPTAQFIGWVDAYLKEFGRQPASIEDFEFEAQRILYFKNQTKAAIARMKRTIKERPNGKNAVAAASLVLDTYVSNTLWPELRETAEFFIATPTLGDAEFKKRISGIPGDAYFKIIEALYKKEAFAETMAESDQFLKRYSASGRAPEVLFMAGAAAQKLKDNTKARAYLTELLTKFPAYENRTNALLARAALHEVEYNFDEAQADYEASLKTKKSPPVVQRYFLLSLISRTPKPLDCAPYQQNEELRISCDHHAALIYLARKHSPLSDNQLYAKATSGSKETRAIWAALALETGNKFSQREVLTLISALGTGWGELESLFSFALVATINRKIPESFIKARENLNTLGKLRPSTNALARRIELMKELENAAGKLVKLPWAQVKATVLLQVAEAYREFCDELAKLGAPKGTRGEELKQYQKSIAEILEPFRAKEKTIRDQAQEIAGALVLNDLPARQVASKAESIDLSLLDKVALPPPWSTLTLDPKAPLDSKMRALWVDAFKSGSWARLSYFLPELKAKEIVREPSLSLLRAATLYSAGARHEAVTELEKAKGEVAPGQRRALTQALLSQYTNSTAADKAKALADELTVAPPPNGGKP